MKGKRHVFQCDLIVVLEGETGSLGICLLELKHYAQTDLSPTLRIRYFLQAIDFTIV